MNKVIFIAVVAACIGAAVAKHISTHHEGEDLHHSQHVSRPHFPLKGIRGKRPISTIGHLGHHGIHANHGHHSHHDDEHEHHFHHQHRPHHNSHFDGEHEHVGHSGHRHKHRPHHNSHFDGEHEHFGHSGHGHKHRPHFEHGIHGKSGLGIGHKKIFRGGVGRHNHLGAHTSGHISGHAEGHHNDIHADNDRLTAGHHSAGHDESDNLHKHQVINKDKTIIRDRDTGVNDVDASHHSSSFSNGGLLNKEHGHLDSHSTGGSIGGEAGFNKGLELDNSAHGGVESVSSSGIGAVFD